MARHEFGHRKEKRFGPLLATPSLRNIPSGAPLHERIGTGGGQACQRNATRPFLLKKNRASKTEYPNQRPEVPRNRFRISSFQERLFCKARRCGAHGAKRLKTGARPQIWKAGFVPHISISVVGSCLSHPIEVTGGRFSIPSKNNIIKQIDGKFGLRFRPQAEIPTRQSA